MSDQNQWPKPGEQRPDGQQPDASAPAPGSAAEPGGYGQDAPQQQNPYQQPGQPQANPYQQPGQYGQGQSGQQPYGQQQPGQAGQGEQQYGQQPGQAGQGQQQYGQGQYGQGQSGQQGQYGQQPQYGAPQNPYAASNPYSQQYAQPGAYAGYQPYGQRAKTNVLAILSIVFGIGSLLFVFIFVGLATGVAGAIMGHIALGKIKQTGENGRGLALTGIITGWAAALFTILWIVFIVLLGAHAGGGYTDYGSYDSGAFIR